MDLLMLSTFVVAVFLLSVAPGPDMLFIVANGTAGGRAAGLAAALGMSTGLLLHTMAAAAGLSAALAAAPQALTLVRLAGALLLVYLAVSAWRASSRPAAAPSGRVAVGGSRRPALRKVYAMATLTNLSNPKIVLFYLAFLPQFVSDGRSAWAIPLQILALGAVFIVVGLAVDASIGLAAGTFADKVLHRPRFRQRLERASAIIFGGLAARLVLDTR